MKASAIFVLGLLGLFFVFFISSERGFAIVAASLVLFFVVFGFAVRPARDVYYVHTKHTEHVPLEYRALHVVHDCIAVRVHLARLWLLFLPTFAAIGFFTIAAVHGLRGLPGPYEEAGGGIVVLYSMQPVLWIVLAILSAWVGERLALKDAAVCSADSIFRHGPRVAYAFVDRHGEYFGGQAIPLLAYSTELASLVFYNIGNPQLNRLVPAMLFHRVELIGKGVTDLDEATVASSVSPAPVS